MRLLPIELSSVDFLRKEALSRYFRVSQKPAIRRLPSVLSPAALSRNGDLRSDRRLNTSAGRARLFCFAYCTHIRVCFVRTSRVKFAVRTCVNASVSQTRTAGRGARTRWPIDTVRVCLCLAVCNVGRKSRSHGHMTKAIRLRISISSNSDNFYSDKNNRIGSNDNSFGSLSVIIRSSSNNIHNCTQKVFFWIL